MQSALDRRQAIMEALSDRRFETLENLATEFGVTTRTIQNDITVLGCSVPIYTVQGNGGGIRVADGWYVGRRYLHSDQEQLLRDLTDGLQPDQQKVMLAMKVFPYSLLQRKAPFCQTYAKEKRCNLKKITTLPKPIQFSFSTSAISFAVAVTIRMPLSLMLSSSVSSCRLCVDFSAVLSGKKNWSTDMS